MFTYDSLKPGEISGSSLFQLFSLASFPFCVYHFCTKCGVSQVIFKL